MRALGRIVVAGLGLLAAAPAWAFEHKCPEPGTEVWTTLIPPSGRPIRYDGQSGLWCLRSRGGQPINSELGHFRFYARNAQASDIYEKYLTAAAELWPISVGKHTSFLYTSAEDGSGGGALVGNNFYEADLSTDVQRQVTVPAGTFSVIPIVVTIHGQRANYHQSSYTYYYAPDLGMNVKFEYRLIAGSSADQAKSWELTRIRRPSSGSGGDNAAGGGPTR